MWIYYGLSAGVVLGLYDVWTKKAMVGNAVVPVVMWSALFGALIWVPALLLGGQVSPFHPGRTSLIEQVILLPKSAAMTASWLLAYHAVRELPISVAGAVRASGPVWTLAGGMAVLHQFLTPLQLLGLGITVASYYVLSVVGRREGIHVLRSVPVLLMLAATILSALTTVYDRLIITHFAIPLLDVQVYSALHRFALGAIVFAAWAIRGGGARRAALTWSWAIPLVGISWTMAELIYFHAVADPEALVAHLAVLRRTSLIVGFAISAVIFKEANVPLKAVMIAVLMAGMAILLLAG